MVDYSLQRKFDMDAYCARFGRKLEKNPQKKESNKKIPQKGAKKAVKRKAE